MNKPKSIHHAVLVFTKLTLAQALIMTLLTSMAHSTTLNGQELLDKKISLTAENKEIRVILSTIEKQAHVRFTYRAKLIQAFRKVSIQVNEMKLSEVLENVLGPEIIYEVVGTQIILRPEVLPPPDLEKEMLAAVPVAITVSGKVSDETGQPIPGVNILEKGTSNRCGWWL
jgi:TonB-dependent starch-binding outer membrane protein SusC